MQCWWLWHHLAAPCHSRLQFLGFSIACDMVVLVCRYAFGLGRPVTLVVGDVSFLHDSNGLNLLRSGAQHQLLCHGLAMLV